MRKCSVVCTTRPENLCSLRRFVGRTPWSAADALVGLVLVAAMLLCGAGNPACSRHSCRPGLAGWKAGCGHNCPPHTTYFDPAGAGSMFLIAVIRQPSEPRASTSEVHIARVPPPAIPVIS